LDFAIDITLHYQGNNTISSSWLAPTDKCPNSPRSQADDGGNTDAHGRRPEFGCSATKKLRGFLDHCKSLFQHAFRPESVQSIMGATEMRRSKSFINMRNFSTSGPSRALDRSNNSRALRRRKPLIRRVLDFGLCRIFDGPGRKYPLTRGTERLRRIRVAPVGRHANSAATVRLELTAFDAPPQARSVSRLPLRAERIVEHRQRAPRGAGNSLWQRVTSTATTRC
jgi:hypothetical protein